jgi:hypothetical protein
MFRPWYYTDDIVVETDIFHIPSNLVVDQWASDGESRSHRDFLVLHDV